MVFKKKRLTMFYLRHHIEERIVSQNKEPILAYSNNSNNTNNSKILEWRLMCMLVMRRTAMSGQEMLESQKTDTKPFPSLYYGRNLLQKPRLCCKAKPNSIHLRSSRIEFTS